MIPPIWFVELTRIEQSNTKRRANTTNADPLEGLLSISEHIGINDNPLLSNAVSFKISAVKWLLKYFITKKIYLLKEKSATI
jgi:hypothetical protein